MSYFMGLVIGLATLCIIGVFHPIVIKCEFSLGRKLQGGDHEVEGGQELVGIVERAVGLDLHLRGDCISWISAITFPLRVEASAAAGSSPRENTFVTG